MNQRYTYYLLSLVLAFLFPLANLYAYTATIELSQLTPEDCWARISNLSDIASFQHFKEMEDLGDCDIIIETVVTLEYMVQQAGDDSLQVIQAEDSRKRACYFSMEGINELEILSLKGARLKSILKNTILIFVLLDPAIGCLKRFTNGYGEPPVVEGAKDWGPWLNGNCPVSQKLWKSKKKSMPEKGIPGLSQSRSYYPVEVDRSSRLWYARADCDSLFLLPEAWFSAIAYTERVPGSRQSVALPSRFTLAPNSILYLDGSAEGLLTVVSQQGIETFKVIEH